LKQNIGDLALETVEEYLLIMGKILKWVQLGLEIRCEDVVMRRDHLEHLKVERQGAEEASKAREAKYETEMNVAREEFDTKQEEEKVKAQAEADAAAEEGEEAAPVKQDWPEFDLVSFKA